MTNLDRRAATILLASEGSEVVAGDSLRFRAGLEVHRPQEARDR
jgi:hypothetical protein